MKLAEWKKDGTNAIDARIPDEVWMNGITSKITWWK
jgi:hypothetical protein